MDNDRLKWKVLESEYLFDDVWLKARRDRCVRPDGKIVDPYYVMEYPTWVTAVAFTNDNKVLMVRQYRHAVGETIVELPGGCVDDTDENLEAAIRRELLEETGYVFTQADYLGKTSANPSTNANFLHMFMLRGGTKLQEQALDHNEEIDVLLMTTDEVIDLLQENKIMQSMHVTALFFALTKIGKITIRHSQF